jgi:signal transduction histidine kinase
MASYRTVWRALPVQLVLFLVIPLAVVLSAGTFLSVRLHESAMQDLVRARDERVIQLAADDLATRIEQYQMGLTLIWEHLTSGLTLAELAADEPELVGLFDRGVSLSGAYQEFWPVDGSACVQDQEDMFHVSLLEIDSELVGCISLDGLGMTEIADQLHTSHAVIVYLIDDLGRVRFRTGDSGVGEAISDRLTSTGALEGKPGSAEIHEGGIVVAYSPISRTGWTIIMTEPWHEITSSRLRLSQFAPLTVLPVTLLSVLVLGFGTVRVVRPLQRLRQRTAALSGGDLTQLQEPLGGIQEITELQKTLYEMATRLRDAQDTLRDYIGAITRAQEDERFRLAHDLHDDTVQALIALNQRVQMVQRTLKRDPKKAEERLHELRVMVDQAIVDVRRMIQAMRPTYLADLGLVSALRALVQSGHSENLEAHFEIKGEPRRLTDDLELILYRVAQEAMNNILKHAHASQVTVILSFVPSQVHLSIQDDGQGFQVPENLLSLVNSGNYGLVGISERVQLAHGTLSITSTELGGTALIVSIPVT